MHNNSRYNKKRYLNKHNIISNILLFIDKEEKSADNSNVLNISRY